MTWNVFSLVLGIIAWSLGFCVIKKRHKAHGFSVLSFSLCVVSLFFQFLEIGNRVKVRDFTGIEDTIGAVILAAGVLSGITIVLNVVMLFQKNN